MIGGTAGAHIGVVAPSNDVPSVVVGNLHTRETLVAACRLAIENLATATRLASAPATSAGTTASGPIDSARRVGLPQRVCAAPDTLAVSIAKHRGPLTGGLSVALACTRVLTIG